MMDSLRCLFLDANHCKCLQQHGFRSVQNLNQVTPAELSLITKMPDDLCLDIKRRAESFLATDNVAPLNGTDWLSRQMSAQSYISTLCPSINSLIGLPGLPLGRIVEIYGESGSGKTQICFQLCVSVQISPESGGIGGKVLYIDTESSFRPERVLHVAKAMRYASKAQGLPFDDRSLLDNITVLQIREANQMSAFIQYHLHSFLCQHKTVKLVIIDSIALPFRYDYQDSVQERFKALSLISQTLRFVSRTMNVCILVTNQITFSLDSDSHLPCLGEIWSSTAFMKLEFCKLKDNFRSAILQKSSKLPKKRCFFMITIEGVCDLLPQVRKEELEENEIEHRQETHDLILASQRVFRQKLQENNQSLNESYVNRAFSTSGDQWKSFMTQSKRLDADFLSISFEDPAVDVILDETSNHSIDLKDASFEDVILDDSSLF